MEFKLSSKYGDLELSTQEMFKIEKLQAYLCHIFQVAEHPISNALSYQWDSLRDLKSKAEKETSEYLAERWYRIGQKRQV